MTRALCTVAFVCALALSISPANAKPRHQAPRNDSAALTYCVADGSYRSVCPGASARTTARASYSQGKEKIERKVIIVGGRPEGCPHRYCGCALSLKVFGRMVEGLNLAANWKLKFPQAQPGPGMVAARNGHVFLIQSMVDDDTALAWDPNSGKGKIRIHERSLRGYTVVDPNGSRMAMR